MKNKVFGSIAQRIAQLKDFREITQNPTVTIKNGNYRIVCSNCNQTLGTMTKNANNVNVSCRCGSAKMVKLFKI